MGLLCCASAVPLPRQWQQQQKTTSSTPPSPQKHPGPEPLVLGLCYTSGSSCLLGWSLIFFIVILCMGQAWVAQLSAQVLVSNGDCT